ncbi:CBS domain-containing protein [Halalkalibacter akibai]|uniref:Putative signal-transduction protein with CBS domains n=1 Tax=Halalkalibacter akibai (strain ATCC 43226 / DSM 21942 / CIP 109018 / JCM 9157 / 1139) TaxID=1236973 RepID=W4QN12_HALA3|nr:CBS domain-containing protein [Halalkalibacter akibai]GAE33307.1 putative signal-transduction protein with CBS domains [Halalkalibacter akibai JCM 9157]
MPIVADFYQKITKQASTVLQHDLIDVVRTKMSERDPIYRSVYVVDQNNKLLGIITLREILKVLAIRKGVSGNRSLSRGKLLDYISQGTPAGDVMKAPISVRKTNTLEEALELMVRHDIEEIPVVDAQGKVIGDLNAFELVREME